MKQKLLDNLRWFENSGVMLPKDGLWGVAERVAVTNGNEAIEEMLNSFPAWTMHENHCIIEQRRADCNFQTAYMYLLAFKVFNDENYYEIARNILDFLYFRSGLLNRSRKNVRREPGTGHISNGSRSSILTMIPGAYSYSIRLRKNFLNLMLALI